MIRGKGLNIIMIGLFLAVLFGVKSTGYGQTPFAPQSMVRQKCSACHQIKENGKIDVIEETRKTPEEWKVVVDRMTRLNDVPLNDKEFRAVVKELSTYLSLSPPEMAAVAYINSDENSQYREIPKDDLEKRIFTACVRCHTFAKIASHRMTKSQWIATRDLHLGYCPTVVPQMREMDWVKEATDLAEPLSTLFPFDNPEWRAWIKDRQAQDLSGTWNLAGYQPGRGYYQGTYAFTANPSRGDDEYLIEREIQYENGEAVKMSGEGTLYSEYHLRYALSSSASSEKTEGVFDLDAAAMQFQGRWWNTLQDANKYGDERLVKVGGTSRFFALFPKTLRKGSKVDQQLMLVGVGLPETLASSDFQFSDPAVKVKKIERVSEAKAVCTVAVGNNASAGRSEVTIKGVGGKEGIIIYDQVDGIKIFPALGRARVSCGAAYPPQGVQFVARGICFGKDRQACTPDDLILEPVSAQWWLEEQKTGERDDDLQYLQAPIPNGCYTPLTTYGPIEERYQRREGVGLIAVGASYAESGRELKDRALLVVTEPDFVPQLK